jgi:hypothetical protein
MRKLLLTVVAALPASAIAAQTPAVRLINAPDASSQHLFGAIGAIRQLPGGKVLVNDIVKRQLTLLDPALGAATVIADSVSGTANSYGVRPGGLIAYVGDSTLFVDPAGLSMFVIDPAGKIARVASVPRSQDAAVLGSNLLGTPGLDAKGRLVYRGGFGRVIAGPGAALAGRGGGSGDAATRAASMASMFEQPDSTALVRVDLATRKLDTAAFFKIPKNKMNMQQNDRGVTVTTEINPLQTVDDWAVLADGSIALVRGQDYHVDFIHADGSTASSPKIPYDWQRLTDEDKVAIIDSAKAAFDRARGAGPQNGNVVVGGPGGAGAPGGGGMVINFSMRAGEGGGGIRTGDAGSGPQMSFVGASELPDYRPVFSQGSSRGDADGNLWVRTSATRTGAVGGPIYDVIGTHGELIDRVQIPSGRQIIGFGKGGVVYLVARDDSGAWLERTHR